MRLTLAVLAALTAIGTLPAVAANARHPYQNVDRRVDRGGDTGNSRVEELNQQQLDMATRPQQPAPMTPGLGAPLMPNGVRQ